MLFEPGPIRSPTFEVALRDRQPIYSGQSREFGCSFDASIMSIVIWASARFQSRSKSGKTGKVAKMQRNWFENNALRQKFQVFRLCRRFFTIKMSVSWRVSPSYKRWMELVVG